MAEKFSVQAVFTAVDHFSGPVARMSDTLNKFNGRGGAGGGSSKMGTPFKDAGAAIGRMGERARNVRNTVLTLGTAGAFAAHKLVTVGADVESALLAGSSKFGDGIRRNTPAFKELESAAFDLGKTTKFGAVEAAGALNELAASGFSPAAAMKNLPIIAQMAIAGGEELQMASNIALNSMGAFGMLYDEMGQLRGPEQLAANLTRVADVMAYTANQTTASMGSIYESLTEAGPITNVAGMTFEKFAAITGAMSQAGIKGSTAGTAIKNISVRLLSPTTEGSEELRKLKIDEKSFRKMTDPLEQLEVIAKAINTLPKEDKIKALDEYFGKIPLAAASFLANGGFRNARVLENNIIKNSGGSNAKQAAIIADSTDTKMAMLKNKFEQIGKTIFNEIQSPLESAIDKAIKFLDNNEGAISEGFKSGVTFLKDNLPTIGKWLKYGAYAMLGMQAAGALHSVVTFGQDLFLVSRALFTVVPKIWGATTALTTFIGVAQTGSGMGLYTTMASGFYGIAAAAGAAAAAIGSAMLAYAANEELKKSTEGMGILDISGMMIHNAINGGSLDPAKIVSDHQDLLARKRYLESINRDKMNAGISDPNLAMGQYGDLGTPAAVMTMLGQLEKGLSVSPLTIPPEAITVQPANVQPVLNALAAQIAANGPGVVGTEDKNASANQEWFGLQNQTDVNVSVAAEKGTTARATTKHTKPNNHRTGTN